MAVSLTRLLWLCIGIVLVVIPFLPLSFTSGLDAGPVWWPHVQAWMIGTTAILVVALAAGRLTVALKRYRGPKIRVSPRWAVPALAVGLFGAATYAMVDVFAMNPRLVDEIAQLFQARVYAAGRLAAPAPQFPEFFLFLNSFVTKAGWVSQYPPGHPALLGLGVLVGLEWLVNPFLAAASVFLVYSLARQLFGPTTGLLACFLWASSGWVIFMSGTYQSHVSATAFSLAAWVAVLGISRLTTARGVVCGAALGVVGAIRPLDAVAATLPIVVWIVVRRQWSVIPLIALGAAPFCLIVALINWMTFGTPTTFGYTALYGTAHGLGFHTDPYGWTFTPLDALRNAFYAVRRVEIYLFEWPIPAALPIGVWALFGRQKRVTELLVAVGILSLPVCYFFYWHSGFYIGPRFYYGITPFLAIGTARAWKWALHVVRRQNATWFRAEMALRWAAIAVLMWGFMTLLPARARSYQQQFATARLHPERLLAEQGVQRAIVFIPDSWLSRTVARLWALGAPASLVERAAGSLDTCELDGLVRNARRRALTPQAVTDTLTALFQHSDVAPRVLQAPDPSTRLSRLTDLPQRCVDELERDRDGFTLYGQFAWRNPVDLAHGVVFARDLFEQNQRLLVNYPGWEVWRYAPLPGSSNSEPMLIRVQTGNPMEVAQHE